MEALDDHDDVQNVYSNLNMTEEMVDRVEQGMRLATTLRSEPKASDG